MKKCVFAGSFDPVTLGHLNVIEKCSMMFESVVVAIGINEQKKYTYSQKKRFEMLKLACKRFSNVEVKTFSNYLADFMRSEKAVYYVRGVRDSKDMAYEEKSFEINSSLNEDIVTMIFQAPKELINVSSTKVKELIKQGKSVKGFVPDEIIQMLLDKSC